MLMGRGSLRVRNMWRRRCHIWVLLWALPVGCICDLTLGPWRQYLGAWRQPGETSASYRDLAPRMTCELTCSDLLQLAELLANGRTSSPHCNLHRSQQARSHQPTCENCALHRRAHQTEGGSLDLLMASQLTSMTSIVLISACATG